MSLRLSGTDAPTRVGAPLAAEPRNVRVLRASSDYLIVEKPYDMLINSNDPAKRTMQTEMTSLFPELANRKLRHEFYFVHRLDFATSGVMCVALTKRFAREASLAFERRSARKYYLALLRGHVDRDSMIIDKPVGEDRRELEASRRMCTDDEEDICVKPRESRTALLVLERGLRNAEPVTKVMMRPATGRRHQLRVHCRHIGHTVVGDYTYSYGADREPHRTFLHSYRLIIENGAESIDETTLDPFLDSVDPRNGWIGGEETSNMAQRRSIDAETFAEIDSLLAIAENKDESCAARRKEDITDRRTSGEVRE